MTQQTPPEETPRPRRRRPQQAPPMPAPRPHIQRQPPVFLRRQAAFWSGVPLWLRAGILTLFALVLVLSCVQVTRSYIAHEAERRRLEQEAAERASHPLYYCLLYTSCLLMTVRSGRPLARAVRMKSELSTSSMFVRV